MIIKRFNEGGHYRKLNPSDSDFLVGPDGKKVSKKQIIKLDKFEEHLTKLYTTDNYAVYSQHINPLGYNFTATNRAYNGTLKDCLDYYSKAESSDNYLCIVHETQNIISEKELKILLKSNKYNIL